MTESIQITPETKITLCIGFRILPCKMSGRGEVDTGILFEFVDAAEGKHFLYQASCTLEELGKAIAAAKENAKVEIPVFEMGPQEGFAS